MADLPGARAAASARSMRLRQARAARRAVRAAYSGDALIDDNGVPVQPGPPPQDDQEVRDGDR